MSSAKVCQAPGVAAGYPVKGRKEGKPIEPPSTQPDIRAAAYAAQPSEQSSAPPGTPSPPYSVSARRPRPRSTVSIPILSLRARPASSMSGLLFLHRPGRLRQYPTHQRRPSTPQPVFSLRPAARIRPTFRHPPGLSVPPRQALGAVRPVRHLEPAACPSPPAQTPKSDFFSQKRGSGAFRGPPPNFLRVGVGLRPTASTRARRRVQPHTRSRTSGQATPEPASHVTFSPRCSCSSAVFWSWCRLQRL